MHKKKGGRQGLVAVNVDMSKAYHQGEWSFLEGMMNALGYSAAPLNVIMTCVCSVSYRVKFNRKLTDDFLPQRGLRQGDPISLCLIILCAETFSVLQQRAELDQSIEGVQTCPGAPRINHLIFADDSRIVMKATAASANRLQEILALYESQSGQKINRDKSSAFFSKGTSIVTKHQVLQALGMPRESKNKRYLGLPVHLRAEKSIEFE